MGTATQITAKEAPVKSVLLDMANRYGMEPTAFEATIRATVVPANTSREQFAAFLLVAKEYRLNPLLREIYAFPAKGGGIQPIVGIDGWNNIMNSNPQLDGIEFVDHLTEGKITAITCKIYRKDRSHATECTEYLSECQRDTQPWKQWPVRMLRHKALIQCARYAFSLSGIIDPDEAERMEMIDVTPNTKIMPYEVDATKAKSPFKSNALRSQFIDTIKKEYSESKNIPEVDLTTETRKLVLEQMKASGDERDGMGLEEIDLHRQKIVNRLMIATRETPEEDDGTFDSEEVPPFIKQEMEAEKNAMQQ